MATQNAHRGSTRGMSQMQKITPFLWFDGKAEEAMNFYTEIFKNSKVVDIMRYGDAGPGPKGSVMSATFQLEGQEFIALNGGPQFTFSPEADDRNNAAGSPIDTVFPGKSFPPSSARCCRTRIPINRAAS